ncbi:MAG: hypothetical protein ACI9UN_000547 [Granulosicoccus sp.]|jgi:hypothetical protein
MAVLTYSEFVFKKAQHLLVHISMKGVQFKIGCIATHHFVFLGVFLFESSSRQ